MFIAAASSVVVWRAIHSDHSNHGNYHEYHDASLKAEIKENEIRAERRKQDAAKIRGEIISQQAAALRELGVEVNVSSSANAAELGRIVNKAEEAVKQKLKDNLSEELKADKKKIQDIDDAIRRINELQLGETEK